MTSRRLAVWGLGVGLAILAAAPTAFVALQPVQVLPRMGLAPGFSFTDQRGARLTSDDLKGGITLYAIGWGGCGEPCRPIELLLPRVRARLDEAATGEIPVRLVQVSLDPEGDQVAAPDREGGSDGRDGPDGEVWRLVTADTAHLRTVVGEGFDTWHVREPGGGITFDPTLILVDQLGIKRARYRHRLPDAGTVVEHVRELAREARATGAAHLAYEAAHFFACYRTD